VPDNSHDLFAHELEGVLQKYYALKEARRRHPYVGDLIRVLLPYPDGLRRALVIFELEKQRRQDGLPIPATFQQAGIDAAPAAAATALAAPLLIWRRRKWKA